MSLVFKEAYMQWYILLSFVSFIRSFSFRLCFPSSKVGLWDIEVPLGNSKQASYVK